MLVYVDDVLHLIKDAKEDILKLYQVCHLKEGFGPPNRYIRANVNKLQIRGWKNCLVCGFCLNYVWSYEERIFGSRR